MLCCHPESKKKYLHSSFDVAYLLFALWGHPANNWPIVARRHSCRTYRIFVAKLQLHEPVLLLMAILFLRRSPHHYHHVQKPLYWAGSSFHKTCEISISSNFSPMHTPSPTGLGRSLISKWIPCGTNGSVAFHKFSTSFLLFPTVLPIKVTSKMYFCVSPTICYNCRFHSSLNAL